MSFKQDILDDLQRSVKLKEDSRDGILDQLALIDVKIDKMDTIITNIDKKIPPLINNIKVRIDELKAAYDARITAGCRSDITWEITETSEDEDGNESTVYTCVRNSTRQQKNFYGQKYYRKPLNRDFGSNIIAELTGNIVATGITIAVTSDGGIENIREGDLVTDNLDSPTVFSIGSIPKVTGFGTTDVIGFTSTMQGNIGVGSDHFVHVGFGTTTSASVGSAVSFTGVLPEGTTVIGFGTAVATLSFYDQNNGTFSNITRTKPSLILSNVALATTSLGILHIGTASTAPTLILDEDANLTAREQAFTIIRDTKDIDSDFDFEKSPIDPVTIGILGSQSGIGHRSEIVNNGSPPGPVQWNEQQQKPEPAVGAGNVVYYTGLVSWPIITDEFAATSYAVLGQTLVSTASTLGEAASTATNTTTSPTGAVDGAGVCVTLQTNIDNAEAALTSAINANLPEINRLNSISQALRELRDEDELQAYGMLQGASFEKGRANKAKSQISIIEGQDLSEFDS